MNCKYLLLIATIFDSIVLGMDMPKNRVPFGVMKRTASDEIFDDKPSYIRLGKMPRKRPIILEERAMNRVYMRQYPGQVSPGKMIGSRVGGKENRLGDSPKVQHKPKARAFLDGDADDDYHRSRNPLARSQYIRRDSEDSVFGSPSEENVEQVHEEESLEQEQHQPDSEEASDKYSAAGEERALVESTEQHHYEKIRARIWMSTWGDHLKSDKLGRKARLRELEEEERKELLDSLSHLHEDIRAEIVSLIISSDTDIAIERMFHDGPLSHALGIYNPESNWAPWLALLVKHNRLGEFTYMCKTKEFQPNLHRDYTNAAFELAMDEDKQAFVDLIHQQADRLLTFEVHVVGLYSQNSPLVKYAIAKGDINMLRRFLSNAYIRDHIDYRGHLLMAAKNRLAKAIELLLLHSVDNIDTTGRVCTAMDIPMRGDAFAGNYAKNQQAEQALTCVLLKSTERFVQNLFSRADLQQDIQSTHWSYQMVRLIAGKDERMIRALLRATQFNPASHREYLNMPLHYALCLGEGYADIADLLIMSSAKMLKLDEAACGEDLQFSPLQIHAVELKDMDLLEFFLDQPSVLQAFPDKGYSMKEAIDPWFDWSTENDSWDDDNVKNLY